jgi:hypothetical protein
MYETRMNGRKVTFSNFTFKYEGVIATFSHYESWAIPYYQKLFGPKVTVDEVKKGSPC